MSVFKFKQPSSKPKSSKTHFSLDLEGNGYGHACPNYTTYN